MADDAFRAQVDDLAAGIKKRDKVIAHLKEFFAAEWDPMSDGPPDVAAMTMPQLAFLLLLEDQWDDFVDYLQAIWDRTFNDVPTRAADAPRLAIGTIHGIKLPEDGADSWELSLQANYNYPNDPEGDKDEDSNAVITHILAGWEVVNTGAVY